MPALQTPICNLDLKIGNSIIEVLRASDLKDVLEEAQVSITNTIIVIPLVTYLDQCILCFCFSFGLGLGYSVTVFLRLTMKWKNIIIHLLLMSYSSLLR